MTKSTIFGWKLDPDQWEDLLRRFSPRYDHVVADHVTMKPDPADGEPPGEAKAEIAGRADDQTGVEAMVIRLNGATDRPDGGTWHITWSLGPARHAKESNEVIAAWGWEDFDTTVPVILHPARWP